MKKSIFLAILVILFHSCEKEKVTFRSAHQLVLFQVEYINYAWGYSHNGIIIDSSGNAMHFNLPKNWHSSDTASYLSVAYLNENLQQCDTVSVTIKKDTMLKYFSMLPEVSEGLLSKPVNTAFDAGTTTFTGYLYDSSINKYKAVLVKRTGDWSISNSAPASEEIYRWLLDTYVAVRTKINQENL